MPSMEVSLPDRIDSQIQRLVEQGDFLNREQAYEELVSMGISAYTTTEDTPDEMADDLFSQAVDDQQDPAARTDLDDGGY
ncbi:DUF7120 family protein [Halomarina litorea]|uniref:DUF7120 family protein n=1 Tax=Halomarina litorea TaxID=2961595 RepID=UPI0020C3D139|nr:CopG family transcriptional regulator [Halomarina sp. BCD28]